MKRLLTALRPHPENTKIYGDRADTALIQSVTQKGILTPLLITADDRIISGHRRYTAAIAAGLTSVPVTYFQSDDELAILEALIESNRQRTKDNEQVGREADALMNIEKERAKRRQAENAKETTAKRTNSEKSTKPESVPASEKRDSRDAVGEKVGTSGKTAEQSAFCVRVMDALGRIGKTVEAHQIRQLLRKNVGKAYRLAKDLAPLTKPPAEQPLLTVPKPQKYITLDYWQTLEEAEQRQIISTAPRTSKEGMNEQKTDNIEWAQFPAWLEPPRTLRGGISVGAHIGSIETNQVILSRSVPFLVPDLDRKYGARASVERD